MNLAEALERLKAEKSYAEYALMHNPNDERYISLVDAVDTVTDAVGDICSGMFGMSLKNWMKVGNYLKQNNVCFDEDEELPWN